MDSEMDAAFQVVAFVVIPAGAEEGGGKRTRLYLPQVKDSVLLASCFNKHLPALPQSLQFVNSVQIKTHK